MIVVSAAGRPIGRPAALFALLPKRVRQLKKIENTECTAIWTTEISGRLYFLRGNVMKGKKRNKIGEASREKDVGKKAGAA